MQHLGKSRRQLFEELDQPALLPLPERPYEFARWKNARVSIDYHVAFEGHYYSVPHTLVGQEVQIRATERMLEVFHRSQQVAIHPLSSSARAIFHLCRPYAHPPPLCAERRTQISSCAKQPRLVRRLLPS